MAVEARANKASVWQAIGPSHTEQMGVGTGADHSVPNGSAAHSGTAPRDGVVVVSIPSGLTVRARVGVDVVAVATDQQYFGAAVYTWPIRKGERVSLYGDGTTGTATISMGR